VLSAVGGKKNPSAQAINACPALEFPLFSEGNSGPWVHWAGSNLSKTQRERLGRAKIELKGQLGNDA
jgi:hypothetical protein